MDPSLFSPAALRGLEMRNRAWLAPMCQYMVEAEDGIPTDWHLVHLGARAAGGFGLVVTEATAVDPVGRISPRDTGLWNTEQARAWARIVGFCQRQGGAGRRPARPRREEGLHLAGPAAVPRTARHHPRARLWLGHRRPHPGSLPGPGCRSEERRVGKVRRARFLNVTERLEANQVV